MIHLSLRVPMYTDYSYIVLLSGTKCVLAESYEKELCFYSNPDAFEIISNTSNMIPKRLRWYSCGCLLIALHLNYILYT